MNKPRIPVTSAAFKYRNSAQTDVRKTWDEARAREALQSKVTPLKAKPK